MCLDFETLFSSISSIHLGTEDVVVVGSLLFLSAFVCWLSAKLVSTVSPEVSPEVAQPNEMIQRHASPRPSHHPPPPPPFRSIFAEVYANSPSDKHLQRVATYRLDNGKFLTIARGSITDFHSKSRGAIVNAANMWCFEGSGVDSAITEAGGEEFEQARNYMVADGDGVRLPTGNIHWLGPNKFGSPFGALAVPYVVMASGPDYNEVSTEDPLKTVEIFDKLLRRVYMKCLFTADDNPRKVHQMAFPLISTGAFLGDQNPRRIIKIGLDMILYWSKMTEEARTSCLTDVVLVASTWKELNRVVSVADTVFEGHLKAHVVKAAKKSATT